MILPDRWKQVFLDCSAELRDQGINNEHFELVLFCMVYYGTTYRQALQHYAEFRGEAPERMHSYLCSVLLRKGLEVEPAAFFKRLIGEGGYSQA